MHTPIERITKIVWIAFFAAFIAIGALISFPIGPVPFSLQTLSVALAGLCLGPKNAVVCVIVYIFAGLIGLPVFSGGKAGPGILLGPTGGYLFGFIGLAFISGFGGVYKKTYPPNKILTIIWITIGLIFTYFCGATGLMWSFNWTPTQAFLTGVLPFIPGSILKIFLTYSIWNYLFQKGLLPNDSTT